MLAESYYCGKYDYLPRKRIKGRIIRCNRSATKQPKIDTEKSLTFLNASNKRLGNVTQKDYTYNYKNYKMPTYKSAKKCPKII